ncbi:hypothetical protein BX600DRAFT_145640 [Xylariales sp. PMI_506]|nr:hypothetical protein BX600DRAFT_145640 [Xylariales sp. PMI_506]
MDNSSFVITLFMFRKHLNYYSQFVGIALSPDTSFPNPFTLLLLCYSTFSKLLRDHCQCPRIIRVTSTADGSGVGHAVSVCDDATQCCLPVRRTCLCQL